MISTDPVCFEILLDRERHDDPARCLSAVRSFDDVFRTAGLRSGRGSLDDPYILDVCGEVAHIGFCDHPHAPGQDLEEAIAGGQYGADIKKAAREHRAFIEICLLSENLPVLDRMAILGGLAGALTDSGSLVVAHKAAHSSLPAAALARDEAHRDPMNIIRAIPPPLLFCGFVKYEVEGLPGIWMRTLRADLIGLPDFAANVPDHDWGNKVLETITSLYGHIEQTGAVFHPGDTASLSADVNLTFEAPNPELEFLAARSDLLVIRFG